MKKNLIALFLFSNRAMAEAEENHCIDPEVTRAGQVTMRRGTLLKSLASSESGEKTGILEKFYNRPSQLVKTVIYRI